MDTLNVQRTAVGLQCQSTARVEYLSIPSAKKCARALTSSRKLPSCASRSVLRVDSTATFPRLFGLPKPAPPQSGQTLAVQVYLHECLQKTPHFAPHLELRLVSEVAGVDFSDAVEVTEWKHVDWVRPTVEDPGSKFYGTIHVPEGFGKPGALLIKKLAEPVLGQRDEIYVSNVVVGFGSDAIKFSCHSTVNSVQGERVFFSSDARLPKDTPEGIRALRKQELLGLQGLQPDGSPVGNLNQARVRTDRIYQYDVYNDLSNPDVLDLCRPALGGAGMPFPRRLRSNRKIARDSVDQREPGIESRVPGSYKITSKAGLPNTLPYLPIDEQFNETKTNGFLGDELRAALSLLPSLLPSVLHHDKDHFASFHDVDAMFTEVEDSAANPLLQTIRKVLFSVHTLIWDRIQGKKFPVPKVRDLRQLDWPTDEEFGRQMLAGQNPCVIKGVNTSWLSKTAFNDTSVAGLLEGASLTQRVAEGARMFYVDYVTGFEEYIEKVNSQKPATTDHDATWLSKDRCLHAAYCLLYLRDDGHLVPVAIDVRKKKGGPSTVYTPLDATELWKLVKEMFLSLDSGFHQLVSHYLRAHACTEPFILATMRNVSALHPVFKLMRPHYRYTLHINTNARAILINAGGVLEQTFTTGRYTMEIASFVYGAQWRFDNASFEKDLILRGMVKVDSSGSPIRDAKGHVQPSIDYPYAQDGLQIWYAMKEWFGAYLRLYYDDTVGSGKQVAEDPEIQAFWKDLRENGHPDKTEGWFELTDIASLTEALTIIAWTASAHHAAVNFGQYDYSGYMPNRPSMITKPMPEKGSVEVQKLKANFQPTILSYLPSPADTLQMVLLYKVLSAHAPNEEYLNNDQPEWIADPPALAELSKFVGALDQLDADIAARNAGPSKIRGAAGSRGFPYTLLAPTSPGAGVTGRGIPSSTCI